MISAQLANSKIDCSLTRENKIGNCSSYLNLLGINVLKWLIMCFTLPKDVKGLKFRGMQSVA